MHRKGVVEMLSRSQFKEFCWHSWKHNRLQHGAGLSGWRRRRMGSDYLGCWKNCLHATFLIADLFFLCVPVTDVKGSNVVLVQKS